MVKSMDPSSSPGPDGFNCCFFVSYWSIVGANVVLAIQSSSSF